MVKYNSRKKYRVGLMKNNLHLFTIHSYLLTKYAGMAELADAYDSGSYERKFLRVQVPFPAPKQSSHFCVDSVFIVEYRT